ncbi:hypothetical protein Tco_0781231 [Tanacetum coccineum]
MGYSALNTMDLDTIPGIRKPRAGYNDTAYHNDEDEMCKQKAEQGFHQAEQAIARDTDEEIDELKNWKMISVDQHAAELFDERAALKR